MRTLYFALILLLVMLLFYWQSKAEKFSQPVYLDQMAMINPDPTYFKYSSWERDVSGMSPRDYYLENEANYLNGFAPPYFSGGKAFVDHTDYLDMPPQYRPNRPMSAAAMSMGVIEQDVQNMYPQSTPRYMQ